MDSMALQTLQVSPDIRLLATSGIAPNWIVPKAAKSLLMSTMLALETSVCLTRQPMSKEAAHEKTCAEGIALAVQMRRPLVMKSAR